MIDRWRRMRATRDESGFTLVELLVAMGIFSVLLAVFATSIQSFSKVTVRTLQVSDTTAESRAVFNRFDKQIRSASAINRPALVGANWYVEYRSDVIPPSTCTQWVLRTATHTLAYRTWNTVDSGTTTPGAWRTVSTHVVNTTAQPPFAFTVATTISQLQELTVNLRYQQNSGPVLVNASTFAARNTSTSTVTNPDANGDGVSDKMLCQDIPAPVRP